MNSLETPMAEMSVSTKNTTPELDWSPKSLSHPTITYQKIAVINGVNSGTLTTSTQGAFSFQIPAKVMSLKDSYVSMDLELATSTITLCPAFAGNLSNLFSRVVITADNNTVLADINDFHRYGSMMIAPSMKFETLEQECANSLGFLPSDATNNVIPRAIARRNPYNVLCKNSSFQATATPTVPTILANKTPIDRFTGTTTLVHQENLNPNSYRHFIQKVATVDAFTNISVQFRLKDLLPHTIASLDQLLYFGGSQLQFDFYINSIDFIGYNAGDNALVTTAPAQLPTTTFSNFQFNLATENNPDTVKSIVNKVKTEGLTLNIPYVYGSKTSIGSTSVNVNQVITRTAGNSLLWVAWAPFSNSSVRDITNSHSQLSCDTISGQGTYTTIFDSFTSSLDGIFLGSQSVVDCTRGEHWLYNKNELRGSALQGIEALSNDFVNIDSFLGKSLCQYDPSVEDGLALTENHTWGLTATFTASTTYQHYVYYCCQRKLTIGNFSVQVV